MGESYKEKKKSALVASRTSNIYLWLVWLGMAGSGILFLFIMVVYLNRSASQTWKPLPLPGVFFVSTALVIAITFTLLVAKSYFKTEEYRKYSQWVFIAFFLAICFILMQLSGWLDWVNQGVVLAVNPQADFIYLLTGLHLLHIIIGMIMMVVVLKDALKNSSYVDGYIASLNPTKKGIMDSMVVYWHFLDALWVFLFLFFLLV